MPLRSGSLIDAGHVYQGGHNKCSICALNKAFELVGARALSELEGRALDEALQAQSDGPGSFMSVLDQQATHWQVHDAVAALCVDREVTLLVGFLWPSDGALALVAQAGVGARVCCVALRDFCHWYAVDPEEPALPALRAALEGPGPALAPQAQELHMLREQVLTDRILALELQLRVRDMQVEEDRLQALALAQQAQQEQEEEDHRQALALIGQEEEDLRQALALLKQAQDEHEEEDFRQALEMHRQEVAAHMSVRAAA